jgi:3'(2'), 5'-bisphosphate nucleotidase
MKYINNLGALCNIMKRLVRDAGDITLDYFDDAGYHGADIKADGSPLTLADQKAEDLIRAKLAELTPELLFVGEEMVANGERPDLSEAEYFWVVDPLDGTKEFISGSGDYTVNIALVHKDTPILGVIYAPVHGDLYAGYKGGEATRWLEDTDIEKSIRVRKSPTKGLTIVASGRHGDVDRMEEFLSGFKVNKTIKRGSSLKMCMIAAGKADMYPRFGPTCEWDTAAADAILRAAGGIMTDLEGSPLRYGGEDPKFLNPEFIASSFDWHTIE